MTRAVFGAALTQHEEDAQLSAGLLGSGLREHSDFSHLKLTLI